jgi:hypothetical protein
VWSLVIGWIFWAGVLLLSAADRRSLSGFGARASSHWTTTQNTTQRAKIDERKVFCVDAAIKAKLKLDVGNQLPTLLLHLL